MGSDRRSLCARGGGAIGRAGMFGYDGVACVDELHRVFGGR